MLLSVGDYFYNRLTYPTGIFNSDWLLESAEVHEAIPSKLPAGVATYQRGESPLALDPTQFTALGPQPLQSDGCQSCYAYGKVAGRTNVLVADPINTNVVYLGSDGGGVWKTTNCCTVNTVWTPVTDDPLLTSIAIGDMVLDPNDHNTIYAGTGDLRFGSFSFGAAGVLKSTDAGATWQILGADVFNPWYNPITPPPINYPQYQAIGKVRVDPRDSNNVIVGTKTGVFFSYDAGTTWEGPCLTNNFTTQRQDITGLELVDDGSGTLVYAAVGTRGFNTTVQSDLDKNGANGVYRTTLPTSGCPASWTPITRADNGWTGTGATGGAPYPTNKLGRLDMDISESNPDVIYVQVADIPTRGLYAVYRSADGGETWEKRAINSDIQGCSTGSGQSWYDHGITIDPNNPDVVFISNIDVARSVNGADTFTNLTCGYNGGPDDVHVDNHARAFIGNSSSQLLVGSDGGAYYSPNANAATPADVTFVNLNQTLNTIEFYAGDITANFAISTTPGINGGAQDNGSSVYVWAGNPGPAQWQVRLGGDGMYARIEPMLAQRWYQESQNGNLAVSSTGAYGTYLNAKGGWGSDRLSFILPYEISKYDCDGAPLCQHMIAGTYRVWETILGAIPASSWYINSPDLTKNTLGDRSFINQLSYAITDQTIAIVGTNDGNVQYGYNMGQGTANSATWVNVTGSNAVLPNRPIQDVTIDPVDPWVGYAAIGGFTQNTPSTPGHVYRVTCTLNCATFTWEDKSGNLPNIPVNSILANPNFPQQVFAGTDWGLYYTDDITQVSPTWYRFTAGLPTVMIWEMSIDRGFTTLALFTRARGAYAWPLPSGPIGSYYLASLGPDSYREVAPGGSVTHEFTLQNLGASDGYTLTLSGSAWPTTLLTASPIALGAGESAQIEVQVDAPGTVGAQDDFTLTATSVTTPSLVTVSTIGETVVDVILGVMASENQSQLITNQTALTYTVAVTNTGATTDTYDIALSGNAWNTTSQYSSLQILPGESATNEVYVTVGSGASDTVNVSFTSQLDGNVSDSTILISTKDLQVMMPPDAPQQGAPGASVIHQFTLQNLGAADSYNLAISGNVWPTTLLTSSPLPVGYGEQAIIQVQVDMPLIPNVQDTFSLSATSVTSPTLSVSAQGESNTVVNPGMSTSANQGGSGYLGDNLVYTLAVTNTGDFTDTFSVALGSSLWPTSASASSLELGAGESGSLDVTVTVGAEVYDSVDVTFTSALDGTLSRQVNVSSTRLYRVGLAAGVDQTQSGYLGDDLTYTLAITNTGETTDTFSVALSGGAWSAVPSAGSLELGAGQSGTLDVVVTVGSEATNGQDVTFTSGRDSSVTEQVRLGGTRLFRPGLATSADMALSGFEGDVLVYTLTITNTGESADTFTIDLGSSLWTTSASASSLDLAAGASGTVQVSVTVGAEATDSVVVTVTSTLDASLSSDVTLTSTRQNQPPSGAIIYLPLIQK